MSKIKLIGSNSIKMSDFSNFIPDDDGFNLIDIVNDASLEKPEDTFITAPGSFIYELMLDVDMKKAAELDVESILVEIFRDNPVIPINANKNLSTRANDAKTSYNTKNELIENNQNKVITSAVISLDISKSTRKAVLSKVIPEELIFNEKLRLDAPVVCQDNSYATPIVALPSPVAMMGVAAGATGQSASTLRRDNLRRFGADPAKTNNVTLPLYPTLPSLSKNAMTSLSSGGFAQQAPSLNPRHFNGARVSLQELRSKLQPNVLNDSLASKSIAMAAIAGQSSAGFSKTKYSKLPNNTLIKKDDSRKISAYEVKVQSTIKTIKSIIEVPKENIGDKNFIYIRLTPQLTKSSKSSITLSKTHALQHKAQLDQMMMPIFAPIIEKVREERGRVAFRLTQVDPASTSIVVMRSIVTKNPRDDNRLEKLGEYKLEYHNKSIIVEDNNTSNFEPNNVIYRAISKYNDLTGPFESLVFAGLSNPYIDGVSHEPEDISIVATNEKEWIKIEVTGIPERVTSIRLRREDLRGPGLPSDRTTTIRDEQGRHTVFVLNQNSEITFYDRSAVIGRKYRYHCVLTMLGGTQIISCEDEIIIRNFTNEKSPLNASLSDLSINSLPDGTYSTTMNLNVQYQDDAFQFIRSILLEQGADQSFINEIESNRDEIKNMVVFRVERVDRYTGRRYNLGIHKSGVFSDDEALSAKYLVPKLTAGRRYLYLFRICLVPPSAFLSGVFNNLSSGKLSGIKDIKYLANKYENPTIKRRGTLPSDARLAKSFDSELLTIQGDTGVTLQQDVLLPERKSIAKDVNFKSTNRGNLVTWHLSDGDSSKVDTFEIKVYLNGGEGVSLSSVAYGATKGMYFIDNEFHNELGTKYYTVRVKYSDGSESAEASSAPVIKKSDSNHILRKIDNSDTLVLGTNTTNIVNTKNIPSIGDYKKVILNQG